MQIWAKHLKGVCTQQLDGQVVDLISETTHNSEHDSETDRTTTQSSTVFYPVFSYAVNGREITRKARTGTSHPRFARGDRVTVRYNPGKVEQYYILEDKASSRFGIILIVFGAVIFVIGFFIS